MVRTIENREQFAARMERENKSRRFLLNAYEKAFLPTLKAFNGKVYNKRFRTAIEERLKALDASGRTYVSEMTQHGQEVVLQMRKYDGNNWENLHIKLICKDYRINEAATLEDEIHQKWLADFRNEIESRKKLAKDWGKFLATANELEAAVKKYNELPHVFRDIVARYQFHIY